MTKSAKVYVQVAVDMDANGKMMPREIACEDGSKFAIDRVLGVVPAAAQKAGGQGDRYTIRIKGRITSLFFERSTNLSGPVIGRWFVERK